MAIVSMTVALGSAAVTQPASADVHGVTIQGDGLDSCTAPTTSQMSAFYQGTPYLYWGVYVGGVNRACAQAQLTYTWVSTVTAQGWDLLPIWVGPQNPCFSSGTKISTNTTTAYNQGVSEAAAAYTAIHNLGMNANSPIVYDMEGASSTSTCKAAVKAFMNGWTTRLHVSGETSGLYTSSCQGFIDEFAATSPAPDFVWAANWDNNARTNPVGCLNNGYWTSHQRHHQYRGGHSELYNGVTLTVDSNCSDGPVAGTAPRTFSCV